MPRHAIDIQANYSDTYEATKMCFSVQDEEKHFQEAKIGMHFTHDHNHEQVLTTLSVRSAFDLYLQSRNFPPGSEIIMTAINIPDMV